MLISPLWSVKVDPSLFEAIKVKLDGIIAAGIIDAHRADEPDIVTLLILGIGHVLSPECYLSS